MFGANGSPETFSGISVKDLYREYDFTCLWESLIAKLIEPDGMEFHVF